MGSDRFFRQKGPTCDKIFCLLLVLGKGCLSLATISCVYYTAWAKFNDFIQIERAAFIESYCIYALVNPFFGRKPIYRSKRYMMYFI